MADRSSGSSMHFKMDADSEDEYACINDFGGPAPGHHSFHDPVPRLGHSSDPVSGQASYIVPGTMGKGKGRSPGTKNSFNVVTSISEEEQPLASEKGRPRKKEKIIKNEFWLGHTGI